MIRQKITLHDYENWEIYAYYAVTTYYIDEIMEKLWEVGVDPDNARTAYRNMLESKLDTGLCYSNHKQKRTVIVIAKTSSAEEFLNSLVHECTHACMHISTYFGLDVYGERYAYMIGSLCREIYSSVKTLLCNHCRTNKNDKNER